MKNSYFSSMSKEFVNYYATSSFASVSEMHFDFSRLTTNEIIFGSFNVANQDPGYTQYILNWADWIIYDFIVFTYN